MNTKQISLASNGSIRGLGDVVHAVAQPIAKAIDAVAKTNISKCGGCQKRRDKLNQIVPFRAAEKS